MVRFCASPWTVPTGVLTFAARYRVLDLVDTDAPRGQGVGIELDPHGVALAAVDLDLADAVDRRQRGRDHLLREGVEGRQRRGGAGPVPREGSARRPG